jgi:hypothetical protein
MTWDRKKKGKFTMTQKEAQLVVDGIVNIEKGDDDDCPLCVDYSCTHNHPGSSCEPNCPIQRYTGQEGCNGTPIMGWADEETQDEEIIAFGKKMLDAAGYEIAEEEEE